MSRLTDYAIVLMTHLAASPDRMLNAHEIAEGAHLRLPTTSKLLRLLAREGLLVSHRGAKGGFGLARPADEITIASIIRALEGPIALTVCAGDPPACEHESLCAVRGHWQKINLVVRDALESVTLADMASPHPLLWMRGRGRDLASAARPG